jgi:hypothetical protein
MNTRPQRGSWRCGDWIRRVPELCGERRAAVVRPFCLSGRAVVFREQQQLMMT